MPLTPGATLGSYTILSAIGAGGMGEVYRARDTKLDREVAIKVLPESFAADADRAARFTREAKTLASLNHPNIAQIFGVEEQGATRALVMELVDGQDLSELIAAHRPAGIPLADALPLAKQIADALEAAHEQGVIHRDLKPANIKVRADGTVKVLDFGLARAIDPAESSGSALANSPTLTARATQMGMIIGTAAYMAPEQAKGRAVDKRADIWAFGVVLHEMLTGHSLFAADTIPETLARVIEREPDLSALSAGTPVRIRTLITRCLERDSKRRLRDIGEARLVLESGPLADSAPVATPDRTRGRSLAWIAASIAAAAITGAVVWVVRTPPAQPEQRLAILSPTAAPPQAVSISPDATAVAILADDKIWIRNLDEFAVREIAGTEGARAVFWAPDSAQIGFQARGQLWRADVRGGAPIAIGPVGQDFTPAGGGVWLASGQIRFVSGTSSLMEIPADGHAAARELLQLNRETEVDLHEPSPLADGRGLLMVLHPVAGLTREIQVYSDAERRTVFTGSNRVSAPVHSPTGHVLFDMNGSVWALPFSARSLTATGDPVLVADNARRPSVADDGTVVMLSGNASTALALTWIDAAGRPGATVTHQRATTPRVSPDGRLVVAHVGFGVDADLWVFDLGQGTERRLTFEAGADTDPSWSPDGRFVVYRCGTSACSRPADGSGARVELLKDVLHPAVSPDGKRLVFIRFDAGIFHVDLGPAGLTAPVTAEPTLAVAPRAAGTFDLSPDGRFIAYSARDNGVDAVFVTAFPVSQGKWELPVRLATWPRWSASGDRLFMLDELSRLVDVPVSLAPTFAAGRPEIRVASVGAQRTNGFDRAKDGQSFLVPLPPAAIDSQTRILIIRNWRAR